MMNDGRSVVANLGELACAPRPPIVIGSSIDRRDGSRS